MPLILVALFIDGTQAMLQAALFVVFTAIPATTVGAAGGAAACGTACAAVGGGVGAVLDLIPFTHAAATATLEPLGIAAGFALDICLSATLGAGLILLLAYNEMLYLKPVAFGGIAELLPGFSLLPGWTALTISCIIMKAREEGTDGSALSILGSKLAGGTVFGGIATSINNAGAYRPAPRDRRMSDDQQQEVAVLSAARVPAPERVRVQLRSAADGIKRPQPKEAYAR